MKNKLFGIIFLMIVFGVILTGCKSAKNDNVSNDKRLKVYTSFYIMNDFAHKIGGDKINLTNLVPAGTEPHDWEPTPSDIANIGKADVLIYNGAGMEGWMDKVLGSVDSQKMIVVEASKGLNLIGSKDKDEELQYDPHVWLNPLLAKKEMEAIKKALVKADPQNKDFYEKNYSDNENKFDDLDNEYKTTIAKYTKKDIVVAHQAFGYLCNAYGLNQVAIEGLAAESEPSPARMGEIADFVKKNNIKYIFFEELISPKVAETIAREAGAKTEVLNPLEGLSDEQIKQGKEYFSVMRDNLMGLGKALE